MHTYEIEVTREGRWWIIRAPEIDHLVVSRLVRGLILRHRAGRLVHSGAGLFLGRLASALDGSPWTGRIAAGGPAK
jgi:hypothetical protein